MARHEETTLSPERRLVLCLLPFGEDHPIEAKTGDGATSVLNAQGYEVFRGLLPLDPRQEMRRLLSKYHAQLAGVIIKTLCPTHELAELIFSSPLSNLPLVLVGQYYYHLNVNAVVADNFGGMQAITSRLIANGRRRLVYVGLVSRDSTEHERYLGFLHACARAGIKVESRQVITSYFDKDLIHSFRELFASSEPPDGIVCMFDWVAFRVFSVLKDLEVHVPDQTAVVSFGDDQEIAERCDPPLTTIYNPAREMGEAAARRLIELIQSRDLSAPRVEVLPVGMHLRQSCGTPAPVRAEIPPFSMLPLSASIFSATE